MAGVTENLRPKFEEGGVEISLPEVLLLAAAQRFLELILVPVPSDSPFHAYR
jgi:hypothetical protein